MGGGGRLDIITKWFPGLNLYIIYSWKFQILFCKLNWTNSYRPMQDLIASRVRIPVFVLLRSYEAYCVYPHSRIIPIQSNLKVLEKSWDISEDVVLFSYLSSTPQSALRHNSFPAQSRQPNIICRVVSSASPKWNTILWRWQRDIQ